MELSLEVVELLEHKEVVVLEVHPELREQMHLDLVREQVELLE